MDKIIFTNGCFDIIHTAHIELFKYCKSLNGFVIVGLNSDESVRNLKGQTRPINNQIDRENVLRSIRFIDDVVIFNELTPFELINKIKPDTLVKGGDYDDSITDTSNPKYVVGRNVVNEIKIFKYRVGYSSTYILNKINANI